MKVAKKTIQLINEFKSRLTEKYGELIYSVVLFGSRAKGTQTKDSDYDIVVVLRQDYDWRFEKQLSSICYEFELEKNILADTHLISLNQLNNSPKGKDPLFINALQKGIYAQ